MMTDQEFLNRCQELKDKAAMIRAKLSNISQDLDNQGRPANVPMRRYSPDDRIELARPAKCPASTREAVQGVNVPLDTEDYASLNYWRFCMGLAPVTR